MCNHYHTHTHPHMHIYIIHVCAMCMLLYKEMKITIKIRNNWICVCMTSAVDYKIHISHIWNEKGAHARTHARSHTCTPSAISFLVLFSQISIKKHCKQLQKLTIKITAGDANDAIARICPFSTVNQIKYIKMQHTHGVHARYIAESRAWCMCLCLSVCLTREGETIRIK